MCRDELPRREERPRRDENPRRDDRYRRDDRHRRGEKPPRREDRPVRDDKLRNADDRRQQYKDVRPKIGSVVQSVASSVSVAAKQQPIEREKPSAVVEEDKLNDKNGVPSVVRVTPR